MVRQSYLQNHALFDDVVLFGLLVRHRDAKKPSVTYFIDGWYNKKSEATFSDILAFVRRSIWAENYFNDSSFEADSLKIKQKQWESLLDQLSRAA